MTLEELTKIEARAKAATEGPGRFNSYEERKAYEEYTAQLRDDTLAITAALREAWAARNVAELWQERGIAEWQGAVATLTAENERLRARIAELECLLISWHYGPTMQDTSNAFRSLKEIAKDLAADALEETNDA